MGKADWSLDHLEHDLSAGFHLLGRAENLGGLGAGESSALADGVLRCMNGALQKVSESLEAQALLRRELLQEREAFRQAQDAQTLRIQTLEADLSALRLALTQERQRVELALTRLDGQDTPSSPPEEHLGLPLVLRSAGGDFLGVTDRLGQVLTLDGFLHLVAAEGRCAPGRPGRLVASCWQADAAGWSLTLSITGPHAPRCYLLSTKALRTPSGNNVTLLSGMHVDGRPVPPDFVVQMFRQLRDSLQE